MKLSATFFKFQNYSSKNHLKIINRGTWGKRKNEEQKKLGNMRKGGEQENRGTWGTRAIGQQRDGSKEEQGTRGIRGGEEQGEQRKKGMGEERERVKEE